MIAPSAASIGALIIRTPLFFAPSRQWHSAKHLELAASLAKDISNFKAVAQYSRQAAMMYQEVGRQAAGAEALTKGGRFCEDGDTGIACELYMEAFELYQDDDTGGGNAGSGGDAYRNCSAMLIREKRWSEAVTVLLKYGQACQRSKSVNSQVRCRPIPYEDGYAYAPPHIFLAAPRSQNFMRRTFYVRSGRYHDGWSGRQLLTVCTDPHLLCDFYFVFRCAAQSIRSASRTSLP